MGTRLDSLSKVYSGSSVKESKKKNNNNKQNHFKKAAFSVSVYLCLIYTLVTTKTKQKLSHRVVCFPQQT